MKFTWIMTLAGAAALMNAQSGVQYVSAKDVAAMMAKAQAERKPDEGNFIQPLGKSGPFLANLESRLQAIDTPPLAHEQDAEFIYVVDGAGLFTTGGKLKDEKRGKGANRTGSGVEGGTPRRIAKGDFIMVPPNTPHAFTKTEGKLVIMSIHLPMPAGASK